MTFAIRARSINQPCGTPWIPCGIALGIFWDFFFFKQRDYHTQKLQRRSFPPEKVVERNWETH